MLVCCIFAAVFLPPTCFSVHHLVYTSTASVPLTADELDRHLARWREKNARLGVTGVLLFSEGHILQVLEGGRNGVNKLYNVIASDARHSDVTLLSYGEVGERRFAGWSMGQVNMSHLNPALLLKYSERPTLDPFAVSGGVSMSLFEELMATASIVGQP